jgi:hypothetical protein
MSRNTASATAARGKRGDAERTTCQEKCPCQHLLASCTTSRSNATHRSRSRVSLLGRFKQRAVVLLFAPSSTHDSVWTQLTVPEARATPQHCGSMLRVESAHKAHSIVPDWGLARFLSVCVCFQLLRGLGKCFLMSHVTPYDIKERLGLKAVGIEAGSCAIPAHLRPAAQAARLHRHHRPWWRPPPRRLASPTPPH